VVSQPLDVFGQPIGIEAFDGLDDATVEGAPAVLEQTAVRHVVGEGMLERVLEVREDPGLVEQLRGLQAPERGVQLAVGEVGDGLEQREGDILPDHRRCLEQRLVAGCQSVDPGG
jgi:hypothetical protein